MMTTSFLLKRNDSKRDDGRRASMGSVMLILLIMNCERMVMVMVMGK
jgi:hypothetical protein